MRKKKEKKWAKKLKRHCHRTTCSDCTLYNGRCRITNYPAPAYWDVGNGTKETAYEQISLLYQEGKSPEEIALASGTRLKEVRRCLLDIRKARKAAGIRMIEEEK